MSSISKKQTEDYSNIPKSDHNNNNTDDNNMITEDWEEWDGQSPFWAHCVAGSLAGVIEHAAIFPLDTVRTHIQVCASCIQRSNNHNNTTTTNPGLFKTTSSTLSNLDIGASSLLHSSSSSSSSTTATTVSNAQHRLPLGMFQTIRYLMNEPIVTGSTAVVGTENSLSSSHLLSTMKSTSHDAAVAGWTRLFRGIQAVLIGCVPAHALYFSSYEIVKATFIHDDGRPSTIGSSLAGAAAVTSHDIIMTPIDTVKQRLQIGHYSNTKQAVMEIFRNEGIVAFYRSFPITLLSNIPYGMVMVTTHEACKQVLRDRDQYNHHQHRSQWQIVLVASSIAGCFASAITTPLDRIKTALQTQQLTPICGRRIENCPRKNRINAMSSVGVGMAATNSSSQQIITPKHLNWYQAANAIWVEEGIIGFWRGITPRVLSHTPAVAISWTTYEAAKHYLLLQSSNYSQH